MTFPTVKSDPWAKGKKTRRRRFTLWSSAFWKKLVDQAYEDRPQKMSPATVDMIGDMNELLYGVR